MGKSTISMAMFNSKLLVYHRIPQVYNSMGYGWNIDTIPIKSIVENIIMGNISRSQVFQKKVQHTFLRVTGRYGGNILGISWGIKHHRNIMGIWRQMGQIPCIKRGGVLSPQAGKFVAGKINWFYGGLSSTLWE